MKYVFSLIALLWSVNLFAQGWEWVTAAGGNHIAGPIRMNQGTGICTDDDGNVYVAGFFAGLGVFGKDTLNTYTNTDPLLIKYDARGSVIWARKLTDGPTDYCYSLCLDRAQNLCVTGVESGNYINIFTAKYDRYGNLLWINESRCEDCIAYARGIASDLVGNIYVAGDCKGMIDIDSMSIGSAGKYTVFLIKYDVKGRVLWVRQSQPGDNYFTQAHALAMDAEGHIFLAGEFTDDFQYGDMQLSGKGEQDVFVACFNSSGVQQWLKSWGSKKKDRPRSIAADNRGNFYLTAYFGADPKIKGKNIIGENLMKFSAAGELLWNTQIGVTDEDYKIASYVCTDNDGAPYLTGNTYGKVSLFGDNKVVWNGASDIFVARCSDDGKLLWKLQAGGTGVDEGSAICVDKSGNVYATGYFHNQTDFGSISIQSKSGDDGIWVGKINVPMR